MTNILENIMAYARKDFPVILICLFCLLACVWTAYSVQTYQAEINKAWSEQWERSGCQVKPYMPNITFNYRGVYDNAIED